MPTEKTAAALPIGRSTEGLREALFAAMERVSAGIMTASEANSFAKLASVINGTLKLELDARKLSLKMADSETSALPAPISLEPKEPRTTQ